MKVQLKPQQTVIDNTGSKWLTEENDYLQERKSLGVLYHFTHSGRLSGILSDNAIEGSNTSNLGFKSISLTRDQDLKNVDGRTWGTFRLSLDGDSISDKYKVVPFFDLENLDSTFKKIMPYYTEGEEQVITNKIEPVSKYLLQIDCLDTSPEEFYKIEDKFDRTLEQFYEDRICYYIVNKHWKVLMQLVNKFLPYKYQKIK